MIYIIVIFKKNNVLNGQRYKVLKMMFGDPNSDPNLKPPDL